MATREQLLTPADGLVKIQAGLYRIEGVTCSCGGELRVERCGRSKDFRWETFCAGCLTCDPNGWPTLRMCVAKAAGYFNPAPAQFPRGTGLRARP